MYVMCVCVTCLSISEGTCEVILYIDVFYYILTFDSDHREFHHSYVCDVCLCYMYVD